MVELCCPSATGWASSSDGVLWSVSVQTVLYGSALQYMSGGVVILFFHFRPQVLLQVVSRAVFKFNSFRGELTVLDSKTAQGQKRRTTPPHHHHHHHTSLEFLIVSNNFLYSNHNGWSYKLLCHEKGAVSFQKLTLKYHSLKSYFYRE